MSALALTRAPAVPGGAVLLSVAVHAAALFLLPGLARQAEEQLPPLVATLRFLPASPPAAPAPAVVPAGKKPPSPAPERVLRSPASPVIARETSFPRSEPTAPAAAAPAETAISKSQPPAAPVAAVPAAPAPAANPVAESLALDDYSRALSELLARSQQYPRLAALRGWEGEVRLRLKVARKGNLVAVQIEHSSGHEVLDQNALRMVQDAALPSPPEGLGEREIQVVVPIRYKLQKAS